jgi:hypothetical protein
VYARKEIDDDILTNLYKKHLPVPIPVGGRFLSLVEDGQSSQ